MLTVRVLITIAIISIGSLNAMSFSEDIIMMGTLNHGTVHKELVIQKIIR